MLFRSSLNLLALPASPSQRPDSVRVPETDNTKASDHARARVRSGRSLHDFAHGAKNVVGVDTKLARLLKRVGEEVKEELRVGRRVDMTMSVVVEVVVEVGSVGEVAVLQARRSAEEGGQVNGMVAYVSEDDSVRAVDVERLSFRVSGRTGCRVASCRGEES